MQGITDDLVVAASKGKRDAVVELLAYHYPMVWRMAVGLTGRADVGQGAAKFVMQQSLRAMHAWKDDTAPTRWFLHHTVLTTRRTQKHQPDLNNDVFLHVGRDDPPFVAFVRALRSLPMQQREAFILSRFEKLETRALAVAMDCSTVAAANHLNAATDLLIALAPREFDGHALRVQGAYKSIVPEEQMSLKDIRRNVRRWILPWIIGRTIRLVLGAAIFLGAAWGGWWVWKIVRHSMQ